MRSPGRAALLALAIGAALALAAGPTAAQRPDAVELMRRVQREAAAPDEQVQFAMALIDSGGQSRKRSGTMLSREVASGSIDQMRLIRFLSPPDIKNSGVLTVEHPDRDNDQWLYLPAYHTTRRIAPANRGDRYMGTDFVYEDIMREKIEEYRYRTTGDATVDGVSCVVVEAVPAAPRLAQETAYSRKLLWIDPARAIVLRVDYYGRDGQLFKRFTVEATERVSGKHRGRAVKMEDFARRHTTTVTYHDRRIGAGIPESIFTERYLKRGQ